MVSVDTRIMLAYSAMEEHAEEHAGIFDVETADDLRFALGHVERGALGLGHAGDEIHHQHGRERQPVPGQEIEPDIGELAFHLAVDDVGQVQAVRHHQHAHQGETHGDLVGHDLRRRAHGAEETRISNSTPSRRR